MEKETIQLDFEKMGGLVPAVVQDDVTQKVLMVGFMNEAAFHKTLDTNRVTFSVGRKVDCGSKENKAEIS